MVLLRWAWSKPPWHPGSNHRDLDFNYEDPEEESVPRELPEQRLESIKRQGFAINRSRVKIGHGQEEDFLKAKKLLQDWRHFQLGWAFVARETPIEKGQEFNVCSKEAFVWIVNPLRIRYVRDDSERGHDQAAKNQIVYAFGSGTLQGHLLAGEERFSVEWNKEDGSIWYEIFSFSKPAHFLSLATYPYVRFKQRVFAEQSSDKMIQGMRHTPP